MKYLRKFNENTAIEKRDVIVKKLQYITEEYLADLLDKGFSIFTWSSVIKKNIITPSTYFVELHNDDNPFKWSNIKDSFITYLEYIKDDSTIVEMSSAYCNNDGEFYSKKYNIDNFLNDEIDDRNMYNIILKIENPIIE